MLSTASSTSGLVLSDSAGAVSTVFPSGSTAGDVMSSGRPFVLPACPSGEDLSIWSGPSSAVSPVAKVAVIPVA